MVAYIIFCRSAEIIYVGTDNAFREFVNGFDHLDS